ncbi:cbb3-type cytochrome oxidase assembly protein CcoS [Fluviicola chungangensis]|uniref:Cbb3-type cytochrome oxidase assembly protein CcoS n=2 Tax=Fluviicola chungangensis TaxID=2597671 RepID=A0A556MYF5_9FLAO|nr:cbb3-type cytochrome oxidase assembly protein CcoS [Fluviicola chungangensis]
MGMIYIMLIVSLCLAVFFLVIFLWAARTGQYDDDYSPSVRILYEDDQTTNETNQNNDGNTNSKVRQ